MADALDNQQEVQRSGINKKESRSNEETKKDIIVIRGSGTRSVEKAVVRYDRDTRFRDENMEATPDRDPIAHAIYWEKKVQELRVRNAEMKQRRANETIQKQRLRNAEMQQRRANKTESRSIEETKVHNNLLIWQQCMGGGVGGWLSYDERRRNPATREILMPPPRRMEQRDREREVRNEGAS
ncbi:unnamed protein product [Brassica napus]|uniref:(rape) hypothetical protein n=1 Tax=Brassica napus TaxID=3708 RepID=A0A816MBL0_BRANA|nr:unnamed protein product [Brassica napus]